MVPLVWIQRRLWLMRSSGSANKDGRSYEGEYINDQKDGEAQRLPQPPIFIPMEAEFSCRSKIFRARLVPLTFGLFRLHSSSVFGHGSSCLRAPPGIREPPGS